MDLALMEVLRLLGRVASAAHTVLMDRSPSIRSNGIGHGDFLDEMVGVPAVRKGTGSVWSTARIDVT